MNHYYNISAMAQGRTIAGFLIAPVSIITIMDNSLDPDFFAKATVLSLLWSSTINTLYTISWDFIVRISKRFFRIVRWKDYQYFPTI